METWLTRTAPLLALVASLALGACGSPSSPIGAPLDPSASAEPGDTTSTGAAESDPVATPAVATAAERGAFLATVDAIVADTDYRGLAEADPAGFLQAAELVCARLDAGARGEDVIGDYLAELGRSRNQLTDDDALLAGALVGASVATFCPQHEDDLPEV